MARDMKKKYAADYKWSQENCTRITMRIRNDSGIPEAIDKVKESGKSANSYILGILEKQLRADGYLKSGDSQ